MAYAKTLGLAAGSLLLLSGIIHLGMGAILGTEVGGEVLSLLYILGALFLVAGIALLWRRQKLTCSFGAAVATICVVLLIIFIASGMMATMLISYPILADYQMPMFLIMGPTNLVIIALAIVALRKTT